MGGGGSQLKTKTLIAGLGEAWVLMAVKDDGCRGERRGFSWQSQTLVEVVRGGGSHFCQSRWLWRLEAAFSWQSQKLVVGSRGGGSHGSLRRWLWGGEAGFLAMHEGFKAFNCELILYICMSD